MNVLLGSPLDLSGCIMHRASCFIGWIAFKIPFQTVPRVPSAQLSPQRTSLLFLSFMILFFCFILSFFLRYYHSLSTILFFYKAFLLPFYYSFFFSFFFKLSTFLSFLSSSTIPFHHSFFFLHCFPPPFLSSPPVLLSTGQTLIRVNQFWIHWLFMAIKVTTGSHTYHLGQFQRLQLASPTSRWALTLTRAQRKTWAT